MSLIYLLALVNVFAFYSSSQWWADNLTQLEPVIICIYAIKYTWFGKNMLRGMSLFVLLTIFYSWVALTDWKISYISEPWFAIEIFTLVGISSMLWYRNYEVKSDKINPKNLNLLFYKPRTIKQLLLSIPGKPVSSCGAIIDKLYQHRYDHSTMQELEYDEKDIYEKYVVVDTGYPIKDITKKQINNLLKQKARQPKTLWLRLNCLRSFKDILKDIKGYEYKGEVLPSIYLRRISRES